MQNSLTTNITRSKPNIFEFDQPNKFVAEAVAWFKEQDPNFSLRKKTQEISGLSQSLVSKIASGERRITLEKVEPIAKLLGLTKAEKAYLVKCISPFTSSVTPKVKLRVAPSNHLLSNWLNVYVKDAVRLNHFDSDAKKLAQKLGWIASPAQIEKSLKFLLQEGYIKVDQYGKYIENNTLDLTTHEIPSKKIRNFHKKALEIAKKNIDIYPTGTRTETAMTIVANHENVAELKELLNEFREKLIQFGEQYQQKGDQLFQVLINLTPIGIPYETK